MLFNLMGTLRGSSMRWPAEGCHQVHTCTRVAVFGEHKYLGCMAGRSWYLVDYYPQAACIASKQAELC